MILYSLPPLAVSLGLLTLGFFVYTKNKKAKLNRIFFTLCLSSSIWLFFYSLAYRCKSEMIAFIWLKIGYGGVVFIAVTVFHYTVEFLGIHKIRKVVFLNYIIGLICVFLIWNSSYLIRGIHKYFWGYYPLAGRFHPLFLAFFISLVSISFIFLLYFLWFKKKKPTGLKRMQIKYFFLASFIYNFASLDFLPNYGITIYPFGYLPTFIFLLIIGYTIVRYHLMDIHVAITRIGIFSILYVLLLFIPFYIGYQTKSWVLSTIFAFIFASIGPSIFYRLQKKAVDLILARQRRYQGTLLKMAKDMTTVYDLSKLLRLIAVRVKREVRIRYDAIFFHDRRNKVYSLKYMCGYKLKKKPLLAFKEDEELIEYLKNKEPFLYEETEPKIREYLEDALETSYSLIVPSSIHDELVGFLILGEKLDKSHYSIDDINTFKTLSRQAALAIDHCLFLEEFKRTQEELLQAEKLASIGGMADGIAHQIKNRLNCFNLIAQGITMKAEELSSRYPQLKKDKELKEFFEHLRDSSKLLLENVKRTDDILKSILNFAKIEDKDKESNYFFVKEVLASCVKLLCIKHTQEEFPLEVILVNTEIIWGIKAQLSEVIYNMLDNAYEAIEQLYQVISYEEKKRHTPKIVFKLEEFPQYYLITISDNGIGIKDEDKGKIFAPFFTTKPSSKKSGSGIGMYVVRRIIEENHKGRIWFESKYLKGTTFYIQLPKKGMKI